jgi:glutaminyl-peptide cyclotransferase
VGAAATGTLQDARSDAQPLPSPAANAAYRALPMRARVIASYPHDRRAYTQGLLWEDGALVESAGGYGRSLLRRWQPDTRRTLAEERLPETFFAEGLAAVEGAFVQLTWQEGIAFYRDRETLREVSRRQYEGEGWGLCYDGTHLFMSDGSDVLTRRDPETFLEVGSLAVRADGAPLPNLNELECAEGAVFANVYQTDRIARIDPTTGHVTAMIDASGLLTAEEAARAEVLNGIAYNPESKTFYLTGKYWPRLFEVKFEPVAEQSAGAH